MQVETRENSLTGLCQESHKGCEARSTQVEEGVVLLPEFRFANDLFPEARVIAKLVTEEDLLGVLLEKREVLSV